MQPAAPGGAGERVRRKLIAVFLAVVGVTAGVAVATLSARSASLVRGELLRRAAAEARALAASISGPLRLRDARGARALLVSAAELPDVVEATLVDTQGRVFASTRSLAAGSPAPAHYRLAEGAVDGTLFPEDGPEAGPDAVLLVWPVGAAAAGEAEPRLGSLALRVSTARARAALRANLLASALLTLATTAVSALLLFLFVVRAGLRPLQALLGGVERMAAGDLSARVDTRQLGALADLGVALNGLWADFEQLAERVLGSAERLRRASDQLAGALEEIEGGSESQARSVEETTGHLDGVNASIQAIGAELDDLARATDEASSAVLELGGSVEEVARSVTSLGEAVESSSSSSHEMGASIRQVAESAGEVQRMAEETAVSMTEMDRAIQEIGEHVRQASELASRVSSGAEEGSQAVSSTIQGIEEIRSLTRHAKQVLERLAARIEEIGAVVNVIGEINDEAKLLSLNAAIIAAQAGEQGKAFAVVAQHVKTLAQRTTLSTQQIEQLIGSVQDESGNALAAMATGIDSVEQGVARSRRAGEVLESIRSLAAEANSRVGEISRAAQEQALNSAHVTEAANRTSAMVQKISRAVTEQSRASEQMLQSSESTLAVCRQLQGSTAEQRDSGSFITRRIYAIGERAASVQERTATHARASEAVARAVSLVLEVARKTGATVPELAALAAALREDAEILAAELRRFRGPGGAAPQAPRPARPSSATTRPA